MKDERSVEAEKISREYSQNKARVERKKKKMRACRMASGRGTGASTKQQNDGKMRGRCFHNTTPARARHAGSGYLTLQGPE